MYNVTFYMNTGFNSMNSPDRVSLLETAAQSKKVFPALDIYQIQELDMIRLNVQSYSDIRDADYALIVNDQDATDFGLFSVEDIQMTDMHTAFVSIAINPTLTVVGDTGLSLLDFTDGMCVRHHVASNEDDFGKYEESDPYMTPSEILEYDSDEPVLWNEGEFGQEYTFIEATVDLANTYRNALDYASLNALDFKTDGIDPDIVTVPLIDSTKLETKVKMEYEIGEDPWETVLPNATLFISRGYNEDGQGHMVIGMREWIADAISSVRSLGIESCIISQYNVPVYMTSPEETHDGGKPEGYVTSITGKRKLVNLYQLPFIYPYWDEEAHDTYTVKNNRIFYGDFAKYYIVSTASGNKAEFLPEEIYYDDEGNAQLVPVLEMRVDPRPSGCPYFRFETYRKNNDPELFFTNAVNGLSWANAPLAYVGASGADINYFKWNATNQANALQAGYDQDMIAHQGYGTAINTTTGGFNMLAGMNSDIINMHGAANDVRHYTIFKENVPSANSAYTRMMNYNTNYFSDMINGIGNLFNNANKAAALNKQSDFLRDKYLLNRNAELASLFITNNAVAPSINFPRSDSIRDFVGNNCLVYRLHYSSNDVKRVDKILTMYGYRHTTPINTSLLTNRAKFNYIEAKGVSIKNAGVPKWIRDAVGAQFSAGVRFWHVPIDTTAYTDGSNT